MITTSEQTDKLDAAMAKVLSEVGGLERTAANPFHKSKYVDLPEVWRILRPAALKHGVAISQHPLISERQAIRLETRIAVDGQWMRSELEMPLTKQDPQGWGAGLTYAKRYALLAIFGMAEDDDDGNMASGKGVSAPQRVQEPERKAQPPNLAPQAAKPIQKPSYESQLFDDTESEPPGTKVNIPGWNTPGTPIEKLTDIHGQHTIRFGKNTGKRISEIKTDDLKAMIAWVDGKHAEKAQVAKNVQEAYDHAVKFLES